MFGEMAVCDSMLCDSNACHSSEVLKRFVTVTQPVKIQSSSDCPSSLQIICFDTGRKNPKVDFPGSAVLLSFAVPLVYINLWFGAIGLKLFLFTRSIAELVQEA